MQHAQIESGLILVSFGGVSKKTKARTRDDQKETRIGNSTGKRRKTVTNNIRGKTKNRGSHQGYAR